VEITIQQGAEGAGGITRRNFKFKNGCYENSAYNDGGVPVHYIIVAWMQEPETRKWDNTQKTWVDVPRSKKVQEYMDKFFPHWDKNFGSSNATGAIILGETNSDEIDGEFFGTPREDENRFTYLQELAIELAEEKGLIPEYTTLDIAECKYNVTLYGTK